MANDPADIYGLGDLGAFNQSVVQNDPYGIAGRSLAAWQPDVSTWSPTATGLTAFTKSFMSGLLGNVAKNNAASALNSVIGVLPQLRSDPMSVATPEGVPADAFATLKGNQVLRNYAAAEQKKATLEELMQKVGIAGLTKKAEVLGENAGYDALGQGGLNPDSPAAKNAAAIKAEEDAARNEILTATKYPAVNKFNTTSTALAQLKNIKDLDTASSDIPFATLFIGGLDGSVVREGEYARVQGANPFLDKFRNQLEGALNGTSTLGVDIKKQMYSELQKTQKGLFAEALLQTAPRIATATQRGANAKNILPFDPNMQFEEPATITGAATSEVPPGMKLQRNRLTGETRLVPQ